jgi:hypothetical protein
VETPTGGWAEIINAEIAKDATIYQSHQNGRTPKRPHRGWAPERTPGTSLMAQAPAPRRSLFLPIVIGAGLIALAVVVKR